MKYKQIALIALAVVLGLAACQTPQAPTPSGVTVPTPGAAPTVQPPTAEPVTVTTTVTAIFDAGNSGSLCPKRVPDLALGGPPPIVGEIDDEYRCEGYWTFDVPSIPSGAKILAATFSPGACVVNGKPFKYGDLSFDIADVGTLAIDDYGYGGTQIGLYKDDCPSSIDIASYIRKYSNQTVHIGAGFAVGEFGNGVDDYVSYQANTPTLTIEYSYTQ